MECYVTLEPVNIGALLKVFGANKGPIVFVRSELSGGNQEISLISLEKGWILGLVSGYLFWKDDGGVNVGNKLDIEIVKITSQHGGIDDHRGVNVEVALLAHMVLIEVHSVQGKSMFSVVCNSAHQVELIVGVIGSVVHCLRGFLPAEGPEGRELWLTEDTLVVLNDLLSCARDEEVDLNLSTEGDVAEVGLLLVSISNNGKLGIGISEVHTDILLGFLGLNQEEGVHTVMSTTATSIVHVVLVGKAIGPHAPGTLAETVLCETLSKTCHLVRGENEIHLDVLV